MGVSHKPVRCGRVVQTFPGTPANLSISSYKVIVRYFLSESFFLLHIKFPRLTSPTTNLPILHIILSLILLQRHD